MNKPYCKFNKIFKIILLLVAIHNPSVAKEYKKMVPLKELILNKGFWGDKMKIKYFCIRCSGIYFFTVVASDINKPLDKGDPEKLKRRAKNKAIYLDWAIKMWQIASKYNDSKDRKNEDHGDIEDYVDIMNIAKIYANNSEESKLTCGNSDYGDDLEACKNFIENVAGKKIAKL